MTDLDRVFDLAGSIVVLAQVTVVLSSPNAVEVIEQIRRGEPVSIQKPEPEPEPVRGKWRDGFEPIEGATDHESPIYARLPYRVLRSLP